MEKIKNTSTEKEFARYVSQNILGMLGISAYVLADTFFISVAEGAGGITALNLVLPLYSLIYGIGAMLGVGSAIRFNILRARKDKRADDYFLGALVFALMFSVIFIVMGAFVPDKVVKVLGGNAEIIAIGTPYTRIFLMFAPFFMWNHICNAFVRNDGNPALAMKATLFSSLFNIVMDYVLMFPLGLGMAGAALATAISPIVGILICCIHFFGKKNTIKFLWSIPSFNKLVDVCPLGISAFIGEISSGVTTVVFNFLILGLTGNNGVAAFGVVANISIMAISVFNGIAQGAQPLFSRFYGKGDWESVKRIWKLSVRTAVILAVMVVMITNIFTESIVGIFNSENNVQMANYAMQGVRIYFVGFLFAGCNIVGAGYLSATENARAAFGVSIVRGVVAIIACAVILAYIFGMTGVWLAFPVAECITTIFLVAAVKKMSYRKKN
ncbi:MAG: MATE family efflux transporter [Lachnospiraceae bacterium]